MQRAGSKTQLIAILWALIIISSIMVVYSTHNVRQLFSELESLNDAEYQLEVEWSQLLLEQGAWSSYVRTERLAVETLKMKHPDNQNIVLVMP